MRIKKNINYEITNCPISNSPNLHNENCLADSKENNEILGVKG